MKALLAIVTGMAVLVAGTWFVLRPANGPTSLTPDPAAASGGGPTASADLATPRASATRTARPSASTRATAPPGHGFIPDGWPSPANTGWRHTGVTLRRYGGTRPEIVITRDGTVIDGADIHARVRILANNVTIRRSRVMASRCGDAYGCFVLTLEAGYHGLLLEDVEVTRAANATGMDRAVVVAEGGGSPARKRAVVRRAHVHNTYRGVLVGNHTVIEDSYIADHDKNPPAEAHTAAITAHGGRDVTIRHNTVWLAPSSTASGNLALYGDDAPLENLLIEGNLFNGGGFCLWLTTDFERGPDTFVTIRDNLFGVRYYPACGQYHPVYIKPQGAAGPNFTWADNVWYAPGERKHGKPVKLNS